jgi:hypothetical protein
MRKAKRVHILSTVNAANVSKAGSTYTIKDVCGAIDDIVMNQRFYPAETLAAGVPTLEGKPAPAGHPKNAKGEAISAVNGEALASSWMGSYCQNARHEGGRTLVDVVVNEPQARAHPEGLKLVQRLDAALNGTNVEPIHVSTGLFHNSIAANGESAGQKYREIVTNIRYDHLAILVDGRGAATPEQGVGMFLNEEGQPEQIEVVTLNAAPEDRRTAGLLTWLKRLIGNADISFDQITSGLYPLLPEGAWLREVFERYAVWTDRDGRMWRQDYSISSAGSLAFSGTAVEVTRKVTYEPITTNREGPDAMKDKILAALNAAGIKTEGLDEQQLLTAYNALVAKPVEDKLTAANSKIAEHEATARSAEEAEASALATELATNSSLTVDDLKKLGAKRLRELKATAAPVLPASGGAPKPGDEFKSYDLNSFIDPPKQQAATA